MDMYMPLEDEDINEFSVIPKKGVFLGLDISISSTGLTLCENGVRQSVNFPVNSVETGYFMEVSLRRRLKAILRQYILGKQLDLVIVEDAFQGVNPLTTRKLYAMNTAIDELILDGEVGCKSFYRSDNGFWKSCLFSLDTESQFKGMSDKARIESCLSLLGVKEVGKGYQDRLDSLGMLVAYFLNSEKFELHRLYKDKKKVSFSDLEYDFCEDLDVLIDFQSDPEYLRALNKEYFPNKNLSKELVLSTITKDPTSMYITESGKHLGRFGSSLDLPILESGGVFAVWVKRDKVSKYVGGDENVG